MNKIAPGCFSELVQHAFDARFEIAAKFRAGEQAAEVQRIDARVQQRRRHFFFHDAQRETFRNRGFTHASFADIQRIVLAAAAENLHRALELVSATHQRIDQALLRALIQVDTKLRERIFFLVFLDLEAGLFTFTSGLRRIFGRAVRDVRHDVEPAHTLLLEQMHRLHVRLAKHRDQHVAGLDRVFARRLHVKQIRALQHALKKSVSASASLLVTFRQRIDIFGEVRLDVFLQHFAVHADSREQFLGRIILRHRE